MLRTSRLLGCIAMAVAILALTAPAIQAQCAQARSFGGFPGGKTGAQVIIDASGFDNAGNEFAQFWETGNPGNGTGMGSAGSCDSQGAEIGWGEPGEDFSMGGSGRWSLGTRLIFSINEAA